MTSSLGSHGGYPCVFMADGPVVRWGSDSFEVVATRDGMVIRGASPAITGDGFDDLFQVITLASIAADYLMGVGKKGSVEPLLARLRQRADTPGRIAQCADGG